MRITLCTRIVSIALFLIATGCSGRNFGTLAPTSSAEASVQSLRSGTATRILRGPTFTGPIIVPSNARPTIRSSPRYKIRRTLFISDVNNNQVLLFDPRVPNPSPEGSITSGIDVPSGLATDFARNIYVANVGNNTVTVYPAGQTSPSLTITGGLSDPLAVAVDSTGIVYVTNINNNTITGYQPGETSPFETITMPMYSQPVALAVDSGDNLYVAGGSLYHVYEVRKGSSKLRDLGLTNLNGPVGLAFGDKDTLYVSNYNTNSVTVYKKGSRFPFFSLHRGLKYPGMSAFSSGVFFVANGDTTVHSFLPNRRVPFSTIKIMVTSGVTATPEHRS